MISDVLFYSFRNTTGNNLVCSSSSWMSSSFKPVHKRWKEAEMEPTLFRGTLKCETALRSTPASRFIWSNRRFKVKRSTLIETCILASAFSYKTQWKEPKTQIILHMRSSFTVCRSHDYAPINSQRPTKLLNHWGMFLARLAFASKTSLGAKLHNKTESDLMLLVKISIHQQKISTTCF